MLVMPHNLKKIKEYILGLRLFAAVALVATALSSAHAADYSVRAECARHNQTYTENRIVDGMAGLYGQASLGGNAAAFKLKGDYNHVVASNQHNPYAITVMQKAFEDRHAVNLCLRANDGFIYGVELVH